MIMIPSVLDGRKLKTSEMVSRYDAACNGSMSEPVSFCDEPSWNRNSVLALIRLAEQGVPVVVRTELPRENSNIYGFLSEVVNLLNRPNCTEGRLILAIGSTSEKERKTLFPLPLSLSDFSKRWVKFPELRHAKPILELYGGYPVDCNSLSRLFPPENFNVQVSTKDGELPMGVEELRDDLESTGYKIV